MLVKTIEESWPSAHASTVPTLCAELRTRLAALSATAVDADDAVHLRDKAARLWCARRMTGKCKLRAKMLIRALRRSRNMALHVAADDDAAAAVALRLAACGLLQSVCRE